MNVRWQDIGRCVAALGVVASLASCGAAADVGTATSPTTLPLFESPSTTATISVEVEESVVGGDPTTTLVVTTEGEPTTTGLGSTSTTGAPTTTQQGPVGPIADPLADYCAAAAEVYALGALTEIDDPTAVESYFTSLATAAAGVAAEAPAVSSADAQTVATYRARFLDLLAEADFDLFAAFDALNALDEELSAGDAVIRLDQFAFSNCPIEPPLPEQATAAFYISLLADDEGRTQLAELLAAAEVFGLEGAQCFVGQTTADAIHPLVDAPSTAEQDAALAQTLFACQVSLG